MYRLSIHYPIQLIFDIDNKDAAEIIGDEVREYRVNIMDMKEV